MSQLQFLRKSDIINGLRYPDSKRHLVKAVFEKTAPSYDRFTRWCSLGLDKFWKRELIAHIQVELQPDHRVLDLACGTGDLTFALGKLVPSGRVLGIDLTLPMIHRAEDARNKEEARTLCFCVGDVMDLPLADESVDAVTVGYGLRNFPDFQQALKEIHRLLKPGGLLASLDFSRPANPVWRKVFLTYLLWTCWFFGWLWHREPEAYGYLARSIAPFVHWRQLSQTMDNSGFQVVAEHPRLFGSICIHMARKIVNRDDGISEVSKIS